MDDNSDSLQGTAPGRKEAVDADVIMGEDVPTRASFETVAECYSTLESIAIACNVADASSYLRWAKQVLHQKRSVVNTQQWN